MLTRAPNYAAPSPCGGWNWQPSAPSELNRHLLHRENRRVPARSVFQAGIRESAQREQPDADPAEQSPAATDLNGTRERITERAVGRLDRKGAQARLPDAGYLQFAGTQSV